MGKGKITPMQERILNRFYTSKFPAYKYPFPESIFRGKSLIQTRWGEADLIENLGIKGEKDKDYFTENFYDLVRRGYLMEDKGGFGNFRGYLMTGKGLKIIRGIRKGKSGGLERYSKQDDVDNERKEGGLEKIAASILIILGAFLIFQKILITGAIISTNIYSNGQIFLGGGLVIIGIILFRIAKR